MTKEVKRSRHNDRLRIRLNRIRKLSPRTCLNHFGVSDRRASTNWTCPCFCLRKGAKLVPNTIVPVPVSLPGPRFFAVLNTVIVLHTKKGAGPSAESNGLPPVIGLFALLI